MGTPDTGKVGRGSLGSGTNRPKIDAGTNNQHLTPAPADRYADVGPSAAVRLAKKFEYLAIARSTSYAMEGRSAWQTMVTWEHHVQNWLHDNTNRVPKAGKPPRIQSFLGGAFLRMYLDGKVDSVVVAMAGKSIGESAEFVQLGGDLARHLQNAVNSGHMQQIAPDRVLVLAEAFLKARKKGVKGIAFRNTLNTVIGGVSGVQVDGVELTEERAEADRKLRRYRIDITFTDTYDFQNERSGEYDRYRKRLAQLLLADQYDKFDKEFGNEANPFGTHHKTKLDDAAVFASFMYALEKKKWTPGGLTWSVTVPAEATLTFPIQHPKPSPGRHGAGHR